MGWWWEGWGEGTGVARGWNGAARETSHLRQVEDDAVEACRLPIVACEGARVDSTGDIDVTTPQRGDCRLRVWVALDQLSLRFVAARPDACTAGAP